MDEIEGAMLLTKNHKTKKTGDEPSQQITDDESKFEDLLNIYRSENDIA